MAFDSTAELLFKINADPSDAQGNIQRFRGVLSKDLSVMGAEAEQWAKQVFGSMSSVQGLLVGGAAAIAAGVVAAGAAVFSAAEKTAKFAEQIEDASDKTGIGAVELSKLRYGAEQTGLGFNELTGMLVKFESLVVKAAAGDDQAAAAFARLHISQTQIKAGTQDLLPLIQAVSDRFKGMSSTVEKAAIARELFGRSGANAIEWLSMGSQAMEMFGKRAEQLGRVLTEQDVVAAKAFGMAQKELKAEIEGMEFAIGSKALPTLQRMAVVMIALAETAKKPAYGILDAAKAWGEFGDEVRKAWSNLQAAVDAAVGKAGADRLLPDPTKVKEAKGAFNGFTQIMEGVLSKEAAMGSEADQMVREIQHLGVELRKAQEEFQKLQKDGKTTSESIAREAQIAAQLPLEIIRLGQKLSQEIADKKRVVEEEAGRDLTTRLQSEMEQTYEMRQTAFRREIDQLWTEMGVKDALTARNVALIEQIEAAGLQKIEADRTGAFRQELVDLQQHLAQIVQARMTTRERLSFQYQQDLQRYSEVEEAKALKLATSEDQRATISAQYALNRAQLLQQYGNELSALQNTEGWQGVFGSQFAQLLQHDQEALREWSESADQAFNLVSQSMQMLDGYARKGFQTFAQGMGQNIASAIVYSKSIGEAMRASAAATLESLAAEAFVYAIYSTGLGFLRLAQHDYPAAGQAFTSAAIWGSVGAVAAVAGRAIAPSQNASASGGGAAGAGSGSSRAQTGADTQQQASGPRVAIYIQGHVIGASGIEELTELINDAVENRDVKLSATQSKQAARLVY